MRVSPGSIALQSSPSMNSQASLVPTASVPKALPVSSSSTKLKEISGFPLPSPKQQLPMAGSNSTKLAPQPLPAHLASIKQAIAEDKSPGAVQRYLAQYALQKKAMQAKPDGTVSVNVNESSKA